MRVTVGCGKAAGSIAAPPSKSFTHRALLCAALSRDESVIRNVSLSGDIRATLECVSALGRSYAVRDGAVYFPQEDARPDGSVYPCAESGSTLRFFIPAALARSDEAVFSCSKRLTERGIGIYEALFTGRGIAVEHTPGLITVRGALKPGSYSFAGDVSSQFASGLLMALPMLDGNSTLELIPPVESRPYIDLTLRVMRAFGVTADEERENLFVIRGGQRYACRELTVEGDWSNTAPFMLLNHLGGSVEVTGLDELSAQGDRVCARLFDELRQGREIDIADCPDLGPIMMAAAAYFGGGRICGTRRLKLKESDRASAMAGELEKLGVSCVLEDNSVTVLPAKLHAPKEPISSHNDHRIVMALAVLLTLTGGEIDGAEAVGKSFGGFFGALASLGIGIEE